MKEIEEVNYHLSNYHRDLMETDKPEVAEEYRALHERLKADERAVYDRQCEIRDFIKANKLKSKKKPEQIERERQRRENPPKPLPEPDQMAFPFVVSPPSKIAALIAAMMAKPPADLPSEP